MLVSSLQFVYYDLVENKRGVVKEGLYIPSNYSTKPNPMVLSGSQCVVISIFFEISIATPWISDK